MMSPFSDLKYCLPIIKSDLADVIDDITAASKEYQIIEVWLDYVNELTPEKLAIIVKSINRGIPLFLFRRQNFDQIQMPFEKRCEYLKALPPTAWIDLDIRQQSAEVSWCRQHRPDLFLITSFHDYQATPADSELRAIAAEMQTAGAGIYKFSTFCQSEHDALRLMSLLLDLKSAGKRATVLGMGVHGKATRVIGPLWGSEIAYAPQDMANSSAPGQLSLKQLSAILKELQVK